MDHLGIFDVGSAYFNCAVRIRAKLKHQADGLFNFAASSLTVATIVLGHGLILGEAVLWFVGFLASCAACAMFLCYHTSQLMHMISFTDYLHKGELFLDELPHNIGFEGNCLYRKLIEAVVANDEIRVRNLLLEIDVEEYASGLRAWSFLPYVRKAFE